MESVHLIYLDSPSNLNWFYSVLFGTDHVADAQAQIHRFDDTWQWSPETDRVLADLLGRGGAPVEVANALQVFEGMMSEGPSSPI